MTERRIALCLVTIVSALLSLGAAVKIHPLLPDPSTIGFLFWAFGGHLGAIVIGGMLGYELTDWYYSKKARQTQSFARF